MKRTPSRLPSLTLSFAILLLFSFYLGGPVQASDLKIPAPSVTAKCPVCGMFVSKYPEWIATVVYKDGHAHHFDGVKDMFKLLFNMKKYAKEHRQEDIVLIAVTEYYGLKKIDGRKAFYVLGSDVMGPMGHELVPLANKADAQEFIKDHKGKRILTFDQVTREIPLQLDAGKFD